MQGDRSQLGAYGNGLVFTVSKSAFLAEFAGDPSSRTLADALQDEVLLLLHESVRQRFSEIVEHLNGCGHNLRDYEPPAPGIIALRDDTTDADGYKCDLRLAVDTIVSAGLRDSFEYAGTEGADRPNSARAKLGPPYG